jgi:predicted type IV restriction endonuclease
MTDQYEHCRESLRKLAQDYDDNSRDRNEATTRLHFINRLLLDCLGWSINDCIAETAYDANIPIILV